MKSIVKTLFVGLLMLVAAVAINAGDVLFQDGGLNVSQDLRIGTNALYVNSASGLVGIGTASPRQKLDVYGDVAIGTTNGVLSLFKTYTDASNYEGFFMESGGGPGGAAMFYTNAVGSGTERDFGFGTSGTLRWRIDATGGHWLPQIDNTYDIGESPNYRLRNIYVGTNGIFGGNVGIGTTSPTRTLHVSGNANITGNLAYGSLTQNSPNLIWTEKAFVTCAKAIDGQWYVEYVDAKLNTVREWVNSTNTAWQHKECYEKIQTTTYYFSLNLNESSMPKPENLYFDWTDMQVHQRVLVNQTV